MAFLLVALSCMPCTDDADGVKADSAKTELSKSTTPLQDNRADGCSPFCTCNCCTAFAFIFNPTQTGHSYLPQSEKIAVHLPATVSEISLPVWQPPQLS